METPENVNTPVEGIVEPATPAQSEPTPVKELIQEIKEEAKEQIAEVQQSSLPTEQKIEAIAEIKEEVKEQIAELKVVEKTTEKKDTDTIIWIIVLIIVFVVAYYTYTYFKNDTQER